MAKIAILGAGYVGLTTAACFAHLGHEVVCAEIDPHKFERLHRGELPFFEPGLADLVTRYIETGSLRFVAEPEAAVRDCEFAYLCVPTPQADDGSVDLGYIETAARQIAPVLPIGAVVVNKSTVAVGSAKVVEKVLGRTDLRVVSNPEFLREGSAVADFLRPDRIVIGADDPGTAARVASLYSALSAPVIITDPASAEMVKYAANSFLASKVSFANAIAALCESLGADVDDVLLGLGYDRRIGHEFLRPGPGWGGSCFPKDTRALLRMAQDSGFDFEMLASAIAMNDDQRERMVEKVTSSLAGGASGAVVAAWGLTFKANTDDLRDSPALAVLGVLAERGARIRAFDPQVRSQLPGIEVLDDPYAVCDDAEVLVVLTEWDEFRWLDLARVRSAMRGSTIVDTRNLLDRGDALRAGFTYLGVGR